jgi:osmotically-inducible protein OsmY
MMSATLQRAAESRLHGSHDSELQKIHCTSHLGVLTLHGKVSTFSVRQKAQELIKDLEGLDIIDNQIEVDTASPVES